MKEKSYIKYQLLFFFVLIITLPVLNDVFSFYEFERRNENRSFRDSLQISINHLDRFPKECDEYVNDNFSFRTPLLNIFHDLKFHTFNVSPNPEKTLIGKDEWYFVAGKEVDIFEGELNFSDESLKKFESEWYERKLYLDSMGIKYHWIICPFKHNIYPEKLPYSVSKRNNEKRVDQLKNHLNSIFPNLIIDPSQELIEAKDSNEVFYHLDNHWNYYAGYITSKLLVSQLRNDFPDVVINDIPEYVWKDSVLQQGIHYNVLGIKDISEINIFPVIENEQAPEVKKYGFPSIEGFAYPWDYERRYANPNNENGLKVLFIRDSFGNQLVPFIKEPFKETVFIFDAWRYQLNKEIIETVKPDVVVFLTLETHIESLIKDHKK